MSALSQLTPLLASPTVKAGRRSKRVPKRSTGDGRGRKREGGQQPNLPSAATVLVPRPLAIPLLIDQPLSTHTRSLPPLRTAPHHPRLRPQNCCCIHRVPHHHRFAGLSSTVRPDPPLSVLDTLTIHTSINHLPGHSHPQAAVRQVHFSASISPSTVPVSRVLCPLSQFLSSHIACGQHRDAHVCCSHSFLSHD